MSQGLSFDAFCAHGRTMLSGLGLDPVFAALADGLRNRASHFAYYHNPHVVLSLRLGATADVADALPGWAQVTGEPAVDRFDGGVHEGSAEHVEAYVDLTSQRSAYVLHGSGQSFRIRVSRSESQAGDVRVLLILSHAPFGVAVKPAELKERWQQLTAASEREFQALRPHSAWLAERGAIPSVVDCFAMFTEDWTDTVAKLDALLAALPSTAMHVVARSIKQSRRNVLRGWKQDAVTGVMDPAWAYAILDHIALDMAPRLQEQLGEHTADWRSFRQLEIESGPSIVELRAAAALFDATSSYLKALGVPVTQVHGRKYHRLLVAAGASGPTLSR